MSQIIGAVLALETVIVVQLASLPTVGEGALLWTVFAFAASIPLLSMTMSLMMYFDRKEVPDEERGRFYMGSMVAGCFLGLLGLVTLFWHLNPAAGFLFGCLSLWGLWWIPEQFD